MGSENHKVTDENQKVNQPKCSNSLFNAGNERRSGSCYASQGTIWRSQVVRPPSKLGGRQSMPASNRCANLCATRIRVLSNLHNIDPHPGLEQSL